MKPSRGVFNTEVCIRCLKRKATGLSGHVTVGKRTITAGWCSRCDPWKPYDRFAGWRGHWLPQMNPSDIARGSTKKPSGLRKERA
jgi:hypothetical protein